MCGGKRKMSGGATRLFHNLRVNPHNKHMIFLWWAAGAVALLALIMAAIVPAGVVVPESSRREREAREKIRPSQKNTVFMSD